jgi:hypothetical protein
MACSSPLYSTGASFHLSYRHRKRELSMEAQAWPISGKTPHRAAAYGRVG